MTATIAPTEEAPSTPAPLAPTEDSGGAPGRDLALFLLLLFGTDFSGLLHIYGLSWLYDQPLFLGLGWAMVAIAILLLILPARGLPAWLQFPLRGWAPLGLVAAVVPAALAAGFLLQALTHPPAWVARPPYPDTGLPAVLGTLAFQVGALIGIPALAFYIGYTRDEARRRLLLALLAATLWVLSLVTLLYGAHVGQHAPDTWAIVLGLGLPTALGIGVLIAASGGLMLLRPAGFLAASIGAGLALRVVGLALIPLTIKLGDMLPLIQQATDRLLQRHNPYIVYQMPWDLPLTYWPLNVLSYLPAAAFGIDVRWINLLCGPLIGALLVWAGGRRGPGPAAYAYGLLYLTPTMFQWDISTAAPPYWLWLGVAFAAAVAAARHRPSWLVPGAAVGAALAAAPLALPFVPSLVGWWLQAGWRPALRRAIAAAVVFALLVGPFFLANPANFWNGAVAWFNDLNRLPLLKWQTDKSWAYEIGLAGPFWFAGAQDWLKPLQALVLGGLFVAGLLLRPSPLRTPAAALRWGAAAYLLFMVINPVIWPYLYLPALLALAFAQVPPADGRRTTDDRRQVTHDGQPTAES